MSPKREMKKACLVVAGLMMATGAFFAAAPSAVAEPATSASSTESSPEAIPGYWQRLYYEDYFKNFFTCNSWGNRITGPTSDNIPGAMAFKCYQLGGDLKYSMDIYWN